MAKKIFLFNSTKYDEDKLIKGKRFNFDIVSAVLDFDGSAKGYYLLDYNILNIIYILH